MSEYQYYEFTAIDRPLTSKDVAALRACSSRAAITSTSFVNHYEWGDLKADPADWMRRYFDAFAYLANWGTRRLSLRVRKEAFEKDPSKAFGTTPSMSVERTAHHWIVNWALDERENYERFELEDGSGWMGRLLPLRDELMRGDRRGLYLGWLAAAAAGEVPPSHLEPEVPAGLSRLTAAQQALVEFLDIDVDMIAAAAQGNPSATIDRWRQSPHGRDLDAWLGKLPQAEMADALRALVQGRTHEVERDLKSRFLRWQARHRTSPTRQASARRSVAELRELALAASGVRLEREAREQARLEAKRRKEREVQLRKLMSNVDKHWNAIDREAERRSASGYTNATRLLRDLAEAHALTDARRSFDNALRRFIMRHVKRAGLISRLVEAGLWKA